MQNVKVKTSYSFEVNGIECELRLNPDTDPIHKVRPDGKIVIGYLCQDEDCQNPSEDDGFGSIRSLSRRHINNISEEEARELLESDPDVVPLSYFEHGLCKWDVEGTMNGIPDFQWDGVSFAGVWIPDDCVRESYTGQDGKTRAEWMQEQAASACEQYTSWANGDCWGHVVVTCEPDGSMIDSDECWGYIGSDYAEERLKEEMDRTFNAK